MSVIVRRCTTEDELARSLEIYNTTWPEEAVAAREVAAWNESVDEHVEFLAALDGTDVGSAVAAVPRTQKERCFALLTVLPQQRRRGAGTALYVAVSEWAAERNLAQLETRSAGDDTESLAFAAHRGFHEHSVETGMELDLTGGPTPRFEPPQNVRLTTLEQRPDLAPQMYAVACEAAPDVPGQEDAMAPLDDWLEQNVKHPGVPSAAVVLAVVGDELVGYGKLRIDPGGRTATHYMTGVKRAWRSRGIARALKSAQVVWAKEQGLERLRTTNEVRNAPIRRVNELLGYRPVPGRVTLKGPLAASSASGRSSETRV